MKRFTNKVKHDINIKDYFPNFMNQNFNSKKFQSKNKNLLISIENVAKNCYNTERSNK